MTNKYNEFDKIINTKITTFIKIRLFLRGKFDKTYMLPWWVRKWEPITAFLENWKVEAFFIWKIIDLNWKEVFNLEYIHSFSFWYWSMLLFTFINKYNVKNILYIKSSSFNFWNKVEKYCKKEWVVLKQPWEDIQFI